MDDSYLMHFGVKGMKWGVRRAEKKEAKRQKKIEKDFNKKVKKSWTNSYNKAVDNFNKDLKVINEKYKGEDLASANGFKSEKGQQYVKEVSAVWKERYKDALLSDIGRDPITKGEEWVNRMPGMYMFDMYLDDYFD